MALLFNHRVFDAGFTGAAVEYSAPRLSAHLAQADKYLVFVRAVWSSGGAPVTVTVTLERSDDDLNWEQKSVPVSASISTTDPSYLFGSDTGSSLGGAFLRAKIQMSAASGTAGAHLQVWIAGRGKRRGAAARQAAISRVHAMPISASAPAALLTKQGGAVRPRIVGEQSFVTSGVVGSKGACGCSGAGCDCGANAKMTLDPMTVMTVGDLSYALPRGTSRKTRMDVYGRQPIALAAAKPGFSGTESATGDAKTFQVTDLAFASPENRAFGVPVVPDARGIPSIHGDCRYVQTEIPGHPADPGNPPRCCPPEEYAGLPVKCPDWRNMPYPNLLAERYTCPGDGRAFRYYDSVLGDYRFCADDAGIRSATCCPPEYDLYLVRIRRRYDPFEPQPPPNVGWYGYGLLCLNRTPTVAEAREVFWPGLEGWDVNIDPLQPWDPTWRPPPSPAVPPHPGPTFRVCGFNIRDPQVPRIPPGIGPGPMPPR